MKRVETAISRLMPDIDGKRVLEPACGCAEFSIAATAHAAEVVCFDLDDHVGLSNILDSELIR